MSKSEKELPKGIYEDIDFAVLLQIAGRMIAQHVEAIGKESKLSAGHLSVLGMVHRKPGLIQNVYGSILAINDATLGRYVDKLAEHRLVMRERCENDRRTIRLAPTDEGTRYILYVKSRLAEVRGEVTGDMTLGEINALQEKLVAYLAAAGPDVQEA